MTFRRWVTGLLAAGWLLPACAAVARADDGSRLMTGDAAAVWLVRRKATKFDVLVRPSGRKWQWLARGVYGEPALAAVSGEKLHLFLSKGGHLVYHGRLGGSTTGGGGPKKDNSPDTRWPVDKPPVAICNAGLFAGAKTPTLIAAVRYKSSLKPATTAAATRPAGTQPAASRPATRPVTKAQRLTRARERGHLALFQRVGGHWKFLTERRNLPGEVFRGRIELAVAGKALYMLEVPRIGAARLWRWRPEGTWQVVPLPDEAARQDVLAMRTIHRWLVLVVARPAGEAEDGGIKQSLGLVIREGDDAEFVEQRIVGPGGPLTWDEDRLPLFAAMGDQLALFWPDGKAWKFAPCPVSGEIVALHDEDILQQPAPDNEGAALLETFLLMIMASVLCGTFFLRSRTPAVPPVPPKSLRPGQVWRRFAAALVDVVLAAVAAVVVIAPAMGLLDLAEIKRLWGLFFDDHLMSASVGVFVIGFLAIIAGYGFAMERRFGWTLGKRLFGLHVVGVDGQKPDLRGTLLRNLTKVIELMPWFWPLVLIPLFSRYRLRLGDLLARTIVVQPKTDQPTESGDEAAPESGDQPAPESGDEPAPESEDSASAAPSEAEEDNSGEGDESG